MHLMPMLNGRATPHEHFKMKTYDLKIEEKRAYVHKFQNCITYKKKHALRENTVFI